MIVKFSHHGTGKAAGVLDYLLKSKRSDGTVKPREHATVLQGDPILMAHLIDTVKHKSKYKSGYLSFSERANEISDSDKKKIMEGFEKTLFAGLERDQYDILWIEHADKDIDKAHRVGRLELNFVIPCQELRTGRAFQPYYAPADQKRVNAWKNMVNLTLKTIRGERFSDPDDPKRQRLINPYNGFTPRPSPFNLQTYKKRPEDRNKDFDTIVNPTSKIALEEAIKRQLQFKYEQGYANNRLAVVTQLTEWGLTITRSKNEYSLSVTSDKLTDKNGRRLPIRLKGGMFQRAFNGAQHRVPAMDLARYEYTDPFTVKKRLKNNERTWQDGIKIKEDYHQARYTDSIAPDPLVLTQPKNIKSTAHKPILPSRSLKLGF